MVVALAWLYLWRDAQAMSHMAIPGMSMEGMANDMRNRFLAALLQVLLEHSSLLTPMMASASAGLSAALLIAAGIYQWLPLKEVCLRKCRNPIEFFATRWRAGAPGAFRMGLEHGAYCVGCCWVLMLLLFVAGVMNLLWVALLAGFVLAEKLLPAYKYTSRFASVAFVVSGLVLLIKP